MKIKEEYDVRMPDYSLPYVINGDSSGLNEEDIQAIDKYMSQFENPVISLTEEESYFTSMPAFGLPCNVYDCKIIIFE